MSFLPRARNGRLGLEGRVRQSRRLAGKTLTHQRMSDTMVTCFQMRDLVVARRG